MASGRQYQAVSFSPSVSAPRTAMPSPKTSSSQPSTLGKYPGPIRIAVPTGYVHASHKPATPQAMNISPATTSLLM
jgi:hypothetical protein